ncbi:MAG: sensor of ECF-type sigma factor [Polaribacter sp.]|nr:sensor of ECF-type sigma factor [Polaribacter sp.]
MKNLIPIICISLFCVFSISAQDKKDSKEKIKALKISYLTEQLNLTSNEAEKFWPIYNAYDLEQHELRSKQRSELKKALKSNDEIDALNESDAEKLITLKLSIDRQLHESQKEFINKIKQVISFKKIIKLHVAEMEFGRKLMSKYRHK